MKFYIIHFIIFLFITKINISSQITFFCEADESPSYKSGSSSYIPDSSTEVKYIKVNIHFMLKSDGTGNFRQYDDGMGDTNYTGYNYARDLIREANINYANNRKMWLPPGNNTDSLQMKVRLILEGVYFHDSINSNYYYDSTSNSGLANIYGVSKSCNVFLLESTNPSPSGTGIG